LVKTEVLIIGCGIAGATAALCLARNPRRHITVVTRADDPHESNTLYAQGGIVGRGPDDDPEKLSRDILAAGAGASFVPAVRTLAYEGPPLLEQILLKEVGIEFDRDADGNLQWGNEAAHSQRRILHVGDSTGRAIIQGLIGTIRHLPNISIITDATAVDLITFPHHSTDPISAYHPIACHGAYIFDRKEQTVHRYLAARTILATGGLGRIYQVSTNPPGSRGDGIAMAHRAGARIINAEYIQFHPTALAVPGAVGFLISEAVRGEGGILRTPDGEPFMVKYSPELKDLAPRDIVARAIHDQMETHGYSHVLLDVATKIPADTIRTRFPNIYSLCMTMGIDITRDPIPVVPAAHYSCGGVWVDEWGRSSIHNLYAIGEVSCTGVHGANRLASTSLLEGLVWGNRTAANIESELEKSNASKIPAAEEVPRWDESGLTDETDPALILGDLQTIQNLMWHYVGLVRSANRLSRAIRELRHMWNEIETFYRSTKLSDGLIGLRNAVEVALIVALAARHNYQSRGCHFRQDAIPIEGDRLI
jgi:L-aspartate oxidase